MGKWRAHAHAGGCPYSALILAVQKITSKIVRTSDFSRVTRNLDFFMCDLNFKCWKDFIFSFKQTKEQCIGQIKHGNQMKPIGHQWIICPPASIYSNPGFCKLFPVDCQMINILGVYAIWSLWQLNSVIVVQCNLLYFQKSLKLFPICHF